MGAIYRITHKALGTTYVGSTVGVNNRWGQHRGGLRRGTHDNPRLQHAYNKYGADAFEWAVLEDGLASEDLAGREQHWLDEYIGRGEVYNWGECAANSRRGARHTKETKRKMSEAHKGKRNPFWGHHHTEEARRKMGKAATGNQNCLGRTPWNRGKTLSEEYKRKIGTARARPYPTFVHQETGEIIPAGTNLSKLCRERGLVNGSMWCVIHGKCNHHRGWVLG